VTRRWSWPAALREQPVIEAKREHATVATYRCDGLGRRVWSDVGDVETRYIYDGDGVIEEYVDNSGWELDAVYVHGNTRLQ